MLASSKSMGRREKKYCSAECIRGCFDWLEARFDDFCDVGPELIDRYRDINYLAREISSKNVVLLKGSWLLQQCEDRSWFSGGFVLPPRDELPKAAIWDIDDLRKRICIKGSRRIKIVAVSFAWQTSRHPDPYGIQTDILVRIIQQWMEVFSENFSWDLAIFIDFCSLPQCGRDLEECPEHIDLWFAHHWTDVWLMPQQSYGEAPLSPLSPLTPLRWISSHDDCLGAQELARLEFYNVLSRLEPFGQCKCVLDLSKFDTNCSDWSETESVCAVERLPSLPPESFRENLLNTCCSPEARQLLERVYRRSFEAFTSRKKDVEFQGSSEDVTKTEQLATVLPYYTSLRRLFLNGRELGDYGAYRVMQELPQSRRLTCLSLDSNRLGPLGVSVLADALPKLRGLEELSLQDNHMGDDGIAALAKAAVVCQRLAVLHLDGNDIRSEGVEKLAEYLPSCRSMAKLHLCRNLVDARGACALAKCMAECTALVQLWLDRNMISDEGVHALAGILDTSSCLEKLSLAENSIGSLGGKAIADVIPVAQNLRALSLIGNCIDSFTQDAVLQAWAKAGKRMAELLMIASVVHLPCVESGELVKKRSSLKFDGGDRGSSDCRRARSSKLRRVRIVAPGDEDERIEECLSETGTSDEAYENGLRRWER